MPVMPTRSSKFLARLTASWPVRLSATSRISCGRAACLDLRHLGHQRLVDMRAAGRVEHDDVVALQARGLFGALGDLHRRLARDDGERVDADLPPEHSRAAPARPGASRRARPSAPCACILSVRRLAIFAVVVVLPEPCRPTIMMATGAAASRSIGSASEPSVSTSTSLTILTTIWPGVTDFTTSGADRPGANLVGERAHDVERDVGFEQRAAHFAHGGVDVLLREGAATRQLVEYAGELFRKALEHAFILGWRPARKRPQTSAQSTKAPGGASRCRALAAGLKGPVGLAEERLCREFRAVSYGERAGKSMKWRIAGRRRWAGRRLGLNINRFRQLDNDIL